MNRLGIPRAAWSKPSVWLLVLVNLVPVYGVLALGWDVFPLVLLFWLENVVVGVFNVLRLLVARPPEEVAGPGRLFAIPFFIVHYGIFTLGHGVFVFVLFSGDGVAGGGAPSGLPGAVGPAFETLHLGLPLLALVVSHAWSFVVNFIRGGEYRRRSLAKIMIQPYGRIVVLHVAILVGGMLAHALGSPVWALLLLIVLKIGFDVRAHAREHSQDNG